jgi:hypothetical protein
MVERILAVIHDRFSMLVRAHIHTPDETRSYPQNMWISLCASLLHSGQAFDLFRFSIAVQRLCFTMSALLFRFLHQAIAGPGNYLNRKPA